MTTTTTKPTVTSILRAPVPTSFKEYQAWLKAWKQVYAQETKNTRLARASRYRFRNAQREVRKLNAFGGGTVTLQVDGVLVSETSSRYEREQLCDLRVERKALGAALFRALPKLEKAELV